MTDSRLEKYPAYEGYRNQNTNGVRRAKGKKNEMPDNRAVIGASLGGSR
ncbi:MAG: hypothetical protein WA996_23510 [Candidatus Promineifilaceae bacterium]